MESHLYNKWKTYNTNLQRLDIVFSRIRKQLYPSGALVEHNMDSIQ